MERRIGQSDPLPAECEVEEDEPHESRLRSHLAHLCSQLVKFIDDKEGAPDD